LSNRFLINGETSRDNRDLCKYLLESEEYTYFKNIKFVFEDENKSNIHHQNMAKLKEEEMNSVSYLQNIKSKFDNLEFDEEELSNFYTKIMKKQQFCQDYMSMFNFKVKIILTNR
jgi:hypothetical protein